MEAETRNANPSESNNPNDAATAAEDAIFEAYLEHHLPPSGEDTSGGELTEVTVVNVRADGVLVDAGAKAEAFIPVDEFIKIGDKLLVEVGQRIPVVQYSARSGDGTPRLSHREARHRLARDVVAKAFEEKRALKGRVIGIVKGGIMLDVGLPSFMPASQIDLFKIPDLNSLLGQEMEAYVIEYDQKRHRAVLSRRQLLFERREADRRAVIDKLEVGKTVTGKVKSALEFGVFVDLGGIDGFVPREEVSYDRGTPPSRIVKPGDSISVVITRVDPDSGKITLSRKRVAPDPWENIESRYKVGEITQGSVVSIQQYGAFVHLEEGVTGMVHASDMSWSLGSKKPTDYVAVGQSITAQILEVDREKRRISLGLKQIAGDPWSAVESKYPVGSRVSGTITSLTNYGAFVKIDETLEGMIHVSDIVWDRRLNHPKDVLKVGETVDAVVLKADPENRRLSLGIKQLAESPYDIYQRNHPVGDIVTGKVTRFAPFGAFVELSDGLEGLIHISQIDVQRIELPEKALTLGQDIEVKILKYEPKTRKISLSRREVLRPSSGEDRPERSDRPERGERPERSGDRRGPRGGGRDDRSRGGGRGGVNVEMMKLMKDPASANFNTLGDALREIRKKD